MDETIDWSLTTYEGSRRHQFRRAAELPFDRILEIVEEMGDLARDLAAQDACDRPVVSPPPEGDTPGAMR